MENNNTDLFQHVVENLADGLWVADSEHRIIYANPAMANIAGIPQESIVGAHVLNDFGEETIGDFRKFYLATVNSEKPTKYECIVVTPAGRQTWQSGWLIPQKKDGQYSGMICTVQDTSEKNHSKLVKQASEARFRALLQAIPGVSVIGFGTDGTIHYWNQASERLYGYTANEALGQNVLDLIVPIELHENCQLLIRHLFESGESTSAEERLLRHRDGSLVSVYSSHSYVHVPGQNPEVFCVGIDLTELKRAEEALRKREIYQRALLDNFPFMVWLKDEQSRFLAVNKTFANKFKWPSPESLVGKNDFDITTPEMARIYRSDDRWVMETCTTKQTEELTGVTELEHWVETYKSPLIVDGNVAGTVGFARDITSRKKNELELQAAKAEADRANRAKSHFLAAASHDLRQPLSALSLYVGLLKERTPPEGTELVNAIQNCVGSLSELLTDLLDISKLEAGIVVPKLSDFSLDDMLASLIGMYSLEAEQKGLQIRWRPSGTAACSDPQLFRRILGNLLSNAVRYTKNGGILICNRRRQGRNWIEIWDTGIGIPAGKTKYIFDEFIQLNDDTLHRGSGLGLAIVAKTATLLGLQIRVQSRLGRGSMFAVEVPESTRIRTEPPAKISRVIRPLRIALIDDNELVLQALAVALESVGHRVVRAQDGKTLFERIGEQAPDIVVSDFHLSFAENGFDVIQESRRRFGPTLPAFIITGDTDPAIIRNMAGRGIAVHYKPLSVENLQTIISETVERKQP